MDLMTTAEHTAHLAILARAEWQSFEFQAHACESPQSSYSDSSSQAAPSPPPVVPAAPRRGSRSKRNDPGHISRPPNAFLLFRSDFWAQEKAKDKPVERDHRDISRIAGHCWRSLDPDTKAHYHARANVLKEEHKARYPDYRLRTSARRLRVQKQKTPVVLQKESRCLALAQQVMATTSFERMAAPPPAFPHYTPEFTQSDLDVIGPNMGNPQPFGPAEMEILPAPKPLHPLFYGHGFTIEQNTDLPPPLAPLAQTPSPNAEWMCTLSTLPPLPYYDAEASSLPAHEGGTMFPVYDPTLHLEPDFNVSCLDYPFPPFFDSPFMHPQDADLTQSEFIQIA